MRGDQRGTAVLVVIWMTGILAVMALTFAGRVREASMEVRSAEARLRSTAVIDAGVAELVYQQVKAVEEAEEPPADAANQPAAGAGETAPPDDGVTPMAAPAARASASDDEGAAIATPDAPDAQDEQLVVEVQRPITKTVVSDGVSLYLHAEPEMGRIDVNRGDPRVLRALLEKLANRGVASEAVEVMRKTKERTERIGAIIGEEPPAFVSVEAWIAAIGLDSPTADKVRPFVTTYTKAAAVELAYASPEVIDVLPFLSRRQKDQLAKARARSPQAFAEALAQIASDPATEESGATANGTTADGSQEGTEQGSGQPRQVMRVTVEATVEGIVRRTERLILAFAENSGGSGAGLVGEESPNSGFGTPDATPPPPPPPFTILDRQTLDVSAQATMKAAATAEEAAP